MNDEEDVLVRHISVDQPSENLPVPRRVEEGSLIKPPSSPFLTCTGIYHLSFPITPTPEEPNRGPPVVPVTGLRTEEDWEDD